MSRTLQFKRYANTDLAIITGADGELIIDETNHYLTIHDGITTGGARTFGIPSVRLINGANTLTLTANGNLQMPNGQLRFADTTSQNTAFNSFYINTINNNALQIANLQNVQSNSNILSVQANTIYNQGVNITQNTWIINTDAKMQSAYNQANTDYTTLTAAATVYGNSTFVPVITLTANGRVSSIVNTAITIGYTNGSGGIVTQLTSRTTGVTLNKPSGQITLTSNAMSTGTSNTFVFTNSAISANDFLMINHWSGGTLGNYTFASNTTSGQANVTIRAISTVTAESPILQYVVIKGAAT